MNQSRPLGCVLEQHWVAQHLHVTGRNHICCCYHTALPLWPVVATSPYRNLAETFTFCTELQKTCPVLAAKIFLTSHL